MPQKSLFGWNFFKKTLKHIGSLLTISVTFHSLFKVLFFFRSHYLFAIGLPLVLSVTGNVPRALGCTPKQPDSKSDRGRLRARPHTGFSPSMTCSSKQLWAGRSRLSATPWKLTIHVRRPEERHRDSNVALFPLHSPLLRKSLLLSFPPLNNMLKFSG